MKKMIIAFASLLSLSAFANPTDDLSIKHLGDGAKIKFERNLYFPKGYNIFSTLVGLHKENYNLTTNPECWVVLKTPALADSVIPVNREFEIKNITVHSGEDLNGDWAIAVLEIVSNKINSVACVISGQKEAPTIGYFKRNIADIISIVLPAPVVID